MGMGFAPTWLRQVSPPPASQNHFNQCNYVCLFVSRITQKVFIRVSQNSVQRWQWAKVETVGFCRTESLSRGISTAWYESAPSNRVFV